MQPTLPQQTGGIADMDLTAVQSMDWLFKKERIYLLAQFWQQRATLAEKEVNTLKEQLSSSCTEITTQTSTQISTLSPTSTTASPIICQEVPLSAAVSITVPISTTTSVKNYKLLSPTKLINSSTDISINIPSPPPSQNNINQQSNQPQYQLQNGGLLAEAPSPSPPLSDSGITTPASSTKNSIVNNNCNLNNFRVNRKIFSLNNNNKMADNINDSNDSNNLTIIPTAADMKTVDFFQQQQQLISIPQNINKNNNNNNNNSSGDRTKETSSNSPKINLDEIDDDTNNCNININNNNINTCTSENSNNDNNNLINMQNNNNKNNINSNNSNNNKNSNSSRSLTEELAAKDKELKILIDEVSRLQTLHEQHIEEIQKLKDNLNGKLQLISNLESQLKITNEDSEPKLPKPTIKEEKDEISPIGSPIPIPVPVVVADPKKFQEILLEQTKVLAANQQQHKDKGNIYNSDEPTEQLNLFGSNDINKKYINSYDCSSPEPSTIPTISLIESSINYLSNTQNSKNANVNNSNKNINNNIETSACTDITKIHAQNLKEDEELNKNNASTEQIKDSNDLSSVPESFHNVEQFGTILGEELIKKYWPRSFEIPPLPPSNHSLSILPNENIQHNTLLSLKPITDDGVPIPGTPLSEVATTITKTPVLSSYQNIIPTTSTLGPSSTTLLSQLVNSTFSNSLRTDNSCISSTNNSHNHLHQDMDKSSGRNSTASTPNLHDGRHSTDDHSATGGLPSGMLNPLSLSKNNCNDDNTLGSLSHIPGNFLPGIPFQFQDRNHFRFSDDIQMSGSMAGRLGESLIPKGDPMEAKLQEMLRYNMDKYANQNLDTLHISRRVRELLSVHNIGQRLFAKYVLGLSQGTVSELLSKPKPWDKLTEKGRDSYRKMHAWACDDTAVLLLKSLIPKKGSDPGMPQYSRSDDSMSDDRIAHILSEASQMMKNPTSLPSNIHHQPPQMHPQFHQQHSLMDRGGDRDDLNSNEDSKSPIHSQCPSPTFKDNQPRQRKSDEMSQDKITKIYQEELAKIMSRSQRESFPSGGMPPNPTTPQMPDDNIRVALEAYHRELSKLQQTGGNIPNFPNLSGLLALQHQAAATLNGSAQDLSISKEKEFKQAQEQYNGQINCPSEQSDQNTKDSVTSEDPRHSSAFSLVRPKQEPNSHTNNSTASVGTSSAAASPLGNSILPPAMTPNEDFSSAASPLQRMASITNSLITQPPVTPHHSQPQRPMKAVLPPITQQQFDMFNNLNTEDIVRRVKEALSQYSISQRLFGESVLGLSQGSVSDLLARPKPWHMLTQKGREPFIRMKMFLEDDNAVHKLVASQYKIAPEKLMRTGNYSGSPQIPTGLANKMGSMANLPMQKIMNELKMQENAPQHIMQQMQASVLAHIPTSQHQGMLLTPPGMPPHHAISLTNSAEKKPMMLPVQPSQQANAMRGMHQHMSPTVYEMAALTQDLDTQIITTKIKEALLANNIGQKIFGEAVLGLSQGSVSELLSKPKPWHMLSIKGREPFIRMQLWLSDGNNVERLQVLKNERREASKRRRSTGPGGNQDNSSDTSSNDTADFYTNSPGPGSVGSAGAPPNKKQRVLFSEEQKEALRLAFALDPYPNVATIEFLANELNLATRTITNWFHNHRMRLKQQVPHGAPTEPMPSRENPPATPFDPVQFRILLNQRLVELQKDRMGISGIPIPYPSYFAANPNLAALIGRGLIPTNESELQALNAAFREQMNGLDLSMGSSVKRERDDEFDDDADADNDNEISDSESVDGDGKSDNQKEESFMSMSLGLQSRTSRRKPAAPQWVNPDWQEGVAGSAPVDLVKNQNNKTDKEVIINGVCVMQQQADDYSRKSSSEIIPIRTDQPSNIPQLQDSNDILENGNELKNTECDGNIVTKKDDISITKDETDSSVNILEGTKTDNADNNSEEFSINKKPLLTHY